MSAAFQAVISIGIVLLATALFLPGFLKAVLGSESAAESQRQWRLGMSILLWFATISLAANLVALILVA